MKIRTADLEAAKDPNYRPKRILDELVIAAREKVKGLSQVKIKERVLNHAVELGVCAYLLPGKVAMAKGKKGPIYPKARSAFVFPT